MTQPLISLFGSAVRPWLWPRLIASLQPCKVPFEIIFVGDRVPLCALPPHAHFIYSSVKPAQCFEIGARYASGELLMPFADDVVLSPGALDALVTHHQSLTPERDIASARFRWNELPFTDDMHGFFSGNPESPVLPIMALMHRTLWNRLGGLDARFVALSWDIDLAMRTYELGGRVSLCDEAWVTEHSKNGREDSSTLYDSIGLPKDRLFLESLWVQDLADGEVAPSGIHCLHEGRRALLRQRKDAVVPYASQHLLTRSQGPRGRWT